MHRLKLKESIVNEGEKIFVILRRNFEAETRRHFAGTVESCVGDLIRVRGFLFIHDSVSGQFVRKPEERTRLFRIDNAIKINLLPKDCDLAGLRYKHNGTGTILTDDRAFTLDVSEFTARC